MASIAYICDIKMIDYHRLFGHHTMNFWRFTNTKQFTRFKPGDYLFFLAKGSENVKTREKGIVGYGKLSKQMTSSVSKMWKTYGQLNGYENEDDFKDAIRKATKLNHLPKALNGLFLENIVFFNGPLYLSEIQHVVPRNLESFMYLDKSGVTVTLKILNKAKEIGINSWQFALDESLNASTFDLDYIETFLSHLVYEYLYSLNVPQRHHKLFLDQFPRFKSVKEVRGVYYQRDTKTCVIPIATHIKDDFFFSLISKAMLIKCYCQKQDIQMTIGFFCHEWDEKKRGICSDLGLYIA